MFPVLNVGIISNKDFLKSIKILLNFEFFIY